MSLIYKILTEAEWEAAKTAGRFDGSTVDRKDGYIHFSTALQAQETARRYFCGVDGLVLLSVPTEVLGPELRWEPSRGGDLFPHLYGPLDPDRVTRAVSVPLGADGTPNLGSLAP